jgi:hypothetical protein
MLMSNWPNCSRVGWGVDRGGVRVGCGGCRGRRDLTGNRYDEAKRVAGSALLTASLMLSPWQPLHKVKRHADFTVRGPPPQSSIQGSHGT